MPLIKSKSRTAFGQNLKAEMSAGKPKDQALAIAYRVQREAKRASGGDVPFYARSEAHDIERSGFINGNTAGRADHVPASVRSGGYVIPADIVSSLGQGNSLAGAGALDRMFKSGPYGSHAVAMPNVARHRFADGGALTKIAISDGEYFVPPEAVANVGGGDIDHGHKVLDEMVKHIRKKTIKTLKKLPGPKK